MLEDEDIECLEAAGLLLPDGVIHGVVCDECDFGHSAEVQFDPDIAAHGWYCPDAGFVTRPAEDLAAYRINVFAFACALALAVQGSSELIADQPREIDDRLWDLGRLKFGASTFFGFLAIKLDDVERFARLNDSIRRRARPDFGAVFIPTSAAVLGVQLDLDYRLAPLPDLLSFDGTGGLQLDLDRLSQFLGPGPAAQPAGRKGRRSDTQLTRIVAEALIESGRMPSGRNARRNAIAAHYRTVYPDRDPPSGSAIVNHMNELGLWKPRRAS
ncbi:MAG: hypothetical protein RIF44_04925 [Nitratireductor sp.]